MGKVWDLAQLEPRAGGASYDLAIVDAPATGHGLAMLRAPGTYASIARVGPVGRHAERIDAFVRDPVQTGVLTVALPEEMPVNETIEFERALHRELGMTIDAVIVNAVHPARFSGADAERLRAARGASKVAGAALATALSEHRRARAEHAQVRRLRRACSAPVATLPRVFRPELAPEDLERLSAELERRL
jgi:anion-transporting  ArsA/GET3 family ATPase